jgi:hypothetical protein
MWNVFKSIALLFFWVIMSAGCQRGHEGQIMTWLQPDSLTYVDIPAYDSTQRYAFQANPARPTQLTLRPLTNDVRYSAEVRDGRGTVVAALGGTMRNAVMTLDPDDGLYEVTIQSKGDDPAGMLAILVGSQTVQPVTNYQAANVASVQSLIPFQPLNLTAPLTPGDCTVASSTDSNVNIRSGPGLNYDVIGSLTYGQSTTVTGQTQDGWYRTTLNGREAWISASVVTRYGMCDQAGLLSPGDLQLIVDRDGWGKLDERLSYQDVHTQDVILMTVTNLANIAPDNYREFSLTLFCSGTGVEFIRWGAPEQPTHRCGSSIVLPATPTYNQRWIAVSLPDRSGLSDVNYVLYAEKRKI